MPKEMIIFVGFILLVLSLLYIDSNRKVNVHVCESDNITRYVHLNEPPQPLKFQNCSVEIMKMKKYRQIKNALMIRMR